MLVPSSVSGGGTRQQFLTSFLVNDTIAIDAGSIGFFQDPRGQARVRHLLLSHYHVDHIASLPILLDNIAGLNDSPITLHSSQAVRECLHRDVFNYRLWPDFFVLSAASGPFVQFETLESGKTFTLEGLRITPVGVNHVVPTLGFILESDSAAVVIASDTGPTEELWERANRVANLRAVFLEATFPNALAGLADISKHLTSAAFSREIQKLKRPVRLFAVHLKARFHEQIRAELAELGLPNLEVAQPGTVYEF
jgi:ribonuclease BN (tRNA processing enzyme)